MDSCILIAICNKNKGISEPNFPILVNKIITKFKFITRLTMEPPQVCWPEVRVITRF